MTQRQIYELYKHEAKTACKENGIKVFIKHMTLLETGMIDGFVDYVMFEDRKTGKQYQCYANWKHFTSEHPSKWIVDEYND